MKTTKTGIFAGWIVLLLVAMSCGIPGKSGEVDLTSVAGTVAVELTERVAPPGTEVPPGATVQAGETQLPSATITETAVPSSTVTITPTTTHTPIPCNKASFQGDITIPDGTEITAGTSFIKTWRIKNEGSCTWNSSYQVVFSDGEKMQAPDSIQLTPGSVAPGGTVDISIQLKAPASPGDYTGYFRIKAGDGTIFGVGASNASLSVVIKSVAAAATATFTLPPPPTPLLPDLYVSEFQINNGNPIDDDINIHVRVGVYNKGTATSGPFTVRFWGLETFANSSCGWDVGSLVKNGGYILECDMQYASTYADGLKAKVMVDTGGTVAELDESNNVFLYSLNFVP